jgi:hypothetical protein
MSSESHKSRDRPKPIVAMPKAGHGQQHLGADFAFHRPAGQECGDQRGAQARHGAHHAQP